MTATRKTPDGMIPGDGSLITLRAIYRGGGTHDLLDQQGNPVLRLEDTPDAGVAIQQITGLAVPFPTTTGSVILARPNWEDPDTPPEVFTLTQSDDDDPNPAWCPARHAGSAIHPSQLQLVAVIYRAPAR